MDGDEWERRKTKEQEPNHKTAQPLLQQTTSNKMWEKSRVERVKDKGKGHWVNGVGEEKIEKWPDRLEK